MNKEFLLGILYPARCPVCDGVLPPGNHIHEKCLNKLIRVTGPVCAKCGKPVEEGDPLCDDCKRIPHEFDRGRAAFIYDNTMRQCMSALKYHGRREYGRTLGLMLYERFASTIQKLKPDGIIPVPVHPDRLKKRGYNQAELIAEEVAKESGFPLIKGAVIRNKNTQAMKGLSAEERRKNIREAFDRGPEGILLKRALVIDDIYTTGSTMDAVSHVLKRGGCLKVYFLAVCIGHGFMLQ